MPEPEYKMKSYGMGFKVSREALEKDQAWYRRYHIAKRAWKRRYQLERLARRTLFNA